eukprot:SAG22_NODE_5432_length_1014_cov_1.391257_2_plen_209_part_01
MRVVESVSDLEGEADRQRLLQEQEALAEKLRLAADPNEHLAYKTPGWQRPKDPPKPKGAPPKLSRLALGDLARGDPGSTACTLTVRAVKQLLYSLPDCTTALTCPRTAVILTLKCTPSPTTLKRFVACCCCCISDRTTMHTALAGRDQGADRDGAERLRRPLPAAGPARRPARPPRQLRGPAAPAAGPVGRGEPAGPAAVGDLPRPRRP